MRSIRTPICPEHSPGRRRVKGEGEHLGELPSKRYLVLHICTVGQTAGADTGFSEGGGGVMATRGGGGG